LPSSKKACKETKSHHFLLERYFKLAQQNNNEDSGQQFQQFQNLVDNSKKSSKSKIQKLKTDFY